MYGMSFGGARRTSVRPYKRHTVVVPPDPEDPGSGPVEPGGSGAAMPTTDLSGWKLAFSQDFLTQADEGSFLNVYGGDTYNIATAVGNGRVNAYPVGYDDTRSKAVKKAGGLASNYGHYNPAIISAQDSIMKVHIKTVGGNPQVACPIPRLSTLGKWGSASGGRFAMRIRSDVLPTRKVALLTWPRTGGNTSGATAGSKDAAGVYIGGNGEIDFPEQDLDGTDRIALFMHRQNGTSGSDQYGVTHSTAKLTDAGWHTLELEWLMGSSLKAFVDGVQLGTTQTSRVPATPMDWKLQMETILSLAKPLDLSVDGYIYIDWLVYWTPL